MSVISRKIIIAGVFTLALCSCGNNNPSGDTERQRTVYVTRPEVDSDSGSRHFSAAVEEGKSVSVSFKTGGQIKRLMLKEGDRVAAGSVIGMLDDVDYRLSLQQVQSQFNQTESEVKRLEEMYRRNNIAPNDYEKAKSGAEQLKAQLDIVKNKLAYTRLVAPVSGYVVEKYMEEGEMAGAGTPVYRILGTGSLEASVALPAPVYARRGEISRCTGRSEATGDVEIPLSIISFVPDADNNALFRMRLGIPPDYRGRLEPGMNMTVSLDFQSPGEEQQISVIPSRSIFEKNGKEFVWVVDMLDSTVSSKEVRVIGVYAGARSRVEGLEGDEILVAAGVHHLANREKVRVGGDISVLKQERTHD